MRTIPYPFIALLVVCLAACKKDDPEADPAPTPSPSVPAYQASFTATRSFLDTGNGNTSTGVLATLSLRSSSSTPVTVDSVKVNGVRAVQALTGYYVVDGSMGLDLSNEDLVWQVTDQATGMALDRSLSDMVYPTVAPITSASVVAEGSDHTLACEGVVGADSVIFVLGPLQKRFAGNVSSCTFTAAELQGLVTELYQATITAVRSRTTDVGDVRCRSAKADSRALMVLVE